MVVGLGLGSVVGLGRWLPIRLLRRLQLRRLRFRLWIRQSVQSGRATAPTRTGRLLPWLHRRGLGTADATSNPSVRAEPRLRKLSQFLPMTGLALGSLAA